MPNELFQARLEDDFAEEVHEYREKRHMSKSEAIRDLLRNGLEAAEGEADENHAREDRFQRLAKIGERFSLLATLGALLAIFIPLAAGLSAEAFGLTIGSFGLVVVYGLSAVLMILAAVAGIVSIAGLVILEVQYGVVAGRVGRIIHSIANSPEATPA